jgi:hypothetical protein
MKALIADMVLALLDPLPENRRDALLERAKKAVK